MTQPEPTPEKPGIGNKRDRSPNYPSLTFKEALAAAKKIWDQDKKHPVSVTLASQHLGYKQENGVTLPMIASMKRYGLLVSAGKDVRISDEANTIFLYPEDAPEAIAVIKRLAMLPTLFGKVLEKFPDGLPSDANLRARLQDEWNFASPKAADNFIKALREAVALAGENEVAGGDPVVDNGGQVDKEPSMTQSQPVTIKPPPGTVMPSRPTVPASFSPPGTQSRPWNLGGGTIMMVAIPNGLTPANIERLKKYVAVLESEAAIAWDAVDDDGHQGGASS